METRNQKELYDSFLAEWSEGAGIKVRTSGSTGVPKEIILSKAQVERSAWRTIQFFGINADSELHSAVSFSFIGGKMMIVRALLAGATISYQEPSLTVKPPVHPVRLMSVVPPQMEFVLNRLEDFQNVENFLIGGSDISPALWKRIAESGINAWHSYGMTETASHIGIRKIEGECPSAVPFRPLPRIRLTTNENDCLIIEDEDIRVETNDIVSLNSDGSFFVLGRSDHMINTGGKKILPEEIERRLRDLIPDLPPFYIGSRPDDRWVDCIVMYVLINEKEIHSCASPLLSQINKSLSDLKQSLESSWWLPKEIIPVSSFPLTSSGKLRRL